jgi:hypothetical protein
MITEAADVKPDKTGLERKLTTKPNRSKPSTRYITPTINANMMATGAFASGVMRLYDSVTPRIMSDTIASGPKLSWRLVPKKQYRMVPMKPEYRPSVIGTPASSA